MRDVLIDFKNTILKRGTISQQDILSLESMVGEPVITGEKSINYFTKDATTVGVNEIEPIIDKKIEAINVANTLTVQELLDLVTQGVYKLNDIRENIVGKILAIPQEVVDFINNPAYAELYVNNDKGEQELVQAKDEYLFDMLVYNKEYMNKFLEVTGIENSSYENFLGVIEASGIKSEEVQYFPLLDYLVQEGQGEPILQPLTLGSLLNLKDKVGNAQNNINDGIVYLNQFKELTQIEVLFNMSDIEEKEKTIAKIKNTIQTMSYAANAYDFFTATLRFLTSKQ